MKSIHRVSKVYLVVQVLFYTLTSQNIFAEEKEKPTTATTNSTPVTANSGYAGVPSYGENPCARAADNQNAIIKDLQQKCAGAGLRDCIREAEKCNSSDFDPSGGTINRIGSQLLPILSSSMGMPIVPGIGGMMNGNTDFFKCLPSNRKESYKTDIDKMHREAKEASDKAENYKRDVENEAKDINKEISDTKNGIFDLIEKITETAESTDTEKLRIRTESENSYETAINELAALDSAIAELKGELQIKESDIQNLYSIVFADPEKGCGAQFNQDQRQALNDTTSQAFELRNRLQNVFDLFKKNQMIREFNKNIDSSKEQYKKDLYFKYGKCLESKKMEYRISHKKLSTDLSRMQTKIKDLESKRVFAIKKIKKIPELLNFALEKLEKKTKSSQELAKNKVINLQSEIQQTMSTYQDKKQRAELENQKKQIALQMANMQRGNFQAIFQMAHFGDAAPIVNTIAYAAKMKCEECEKARDPKHMCKGPSAEDLLDSNY